MRDNIDVSVLIPTKNEEISIAQFIGWVMEGFERANVKGELILLDSSSDETPRIATEMGVRVVNVFEPGLGNAYKAGRGVARGKVLILGDADCTYDFRDIKPFLTKISEGYDLVIGNRFAGTIEKGAMPKHHQYFGSPATSWIFKRVLGIPTGDIHCGIRAIRPNLYNKLPFLEQGWEYASEMIVAARNLNALIGEIPVHFYKAPIGRLSHYKRGSWLAPFRSGWGTLRVTATYSFDRLLAIPGIVLNVVASLFLALGAFFPNFFSEIFNFGVFGGALILACAIAGSSMASIGVITSFIYFDVYTPWYKWGTTKRAEIALGVLAASLISLVAIFFNLFRTWLNFEPRNLFTALHFQLLYTSYLIVSIFFASLGFLIVSAIGNHLRKNSKQ